MNPLVQTLFTSKDQSIRDVMVTITEAARRGAPAGLALVVDRDNRLLGMATDGDIRRALVRNISIDSPIHQIMVTDPITVPDQLDETAMFRMVTEKVKASGRIRDSKVDYVIVTDAEKRVKDVIDFFDLWKGTEVRNRSVCVFGLGFVGLTLGVTLSDIGFKVYGYDVRQDVLDGVNDGIPGFYEKGLASLLKYHVTNRNFIGIGSLKKNQADIYIISVGTPVDAENRPNLAHLEKAARELGRVLKKGDLVLLRSTVPAGTTRNHVIPILEKESGLKAGEEFYVAFAPERTVEGRALEELRSLPQVIGGLNKRSADMAANFFSTLNHTIVRVGSLEAAEMIKLANNSFRDLSFAFANELALVCDKYDLDVAEVVSAANEGYPRNRIPAPSPGVGGACLRKDPYLLAYTANRVSMTAHLPLYSRRINEHMPQYVFDKIQNFFSENGKTRRPKVFIVGFAFKGEPETSDMRDSPTLELLEVIRKNSQWDVFGYDPIITKQEIEKLEVKGASLREGFLKADCAVIMNNHRSYRDMDILGLAELMNKKAFILDGWSIFPKEEFQRLDGIVYQGLSGKN